VALCPLQLAWLALHLEVLVALGPTESELSGIVADECDSLARERGAGTKVASLHARKEESILIRSDSKNEGERDLPHGCWE
jgi:hypothetical protein